MADPGRPNWKPTDWRGRAPSSAPASGGAASPPGKKRPIGGFQWFLLIACLLALAGVIIGMLALLRPTTKPLFLSIAVGEYTNRNWPPNPWAQADGEALRERFGNDSVQAFQSQERALILDELRRLAERTNQEKQRPLIVHLSAHAVVRDGKVLLIPGLADPNNPATWLPLSDVVGALRLCQGGGLLLLDVAKPLADARLGVVTDEAAAAIDVELTKAQDNNELPFLVLTSASPGQTAHDSVELRRSVFGWYCEQALHGYADGWTDDKPDKKGTTDARVSAKELAAFVIAKVARWAEVNQLPPQVPKLYGKGQDIVLLTPPTQRPEPEIPGAGDYAWLAAAWKERDGWESDGVSRFAPRTFRQLECILLRAERRWLAGDTPDKIQAELNPEVKALRDQRQRFNSTTLPAWSIGEARRRGLANESEVASALRPFLERVRSTLPFKPEELAMITKPIQDKPPEAAPFDTIAAVLLNALLEIEDPTNEQLAAFDDFRRGLRPAPRHTEFASLRFLLELDPQQISRWNKDQPGGRRLVLRVAEAAESAAALDPRALPWLSEALMNADDIRRTGLAQMAVGEQTARREGRQKLEDSLKRYNQIRDAAGAIERGLRQLDAAMAQLPGIADGLAARPPDVNDEKLWAGTVAAVVRLRELLALPAQPRIPATAEIEQYANDLRVRLGRLQEPYGTSAADGLLARSDLTGNDLRVRLRSPNWLSADRARLIAAADKLARPKVEQLVSQLSGHDLPARPAGTAPTDPSAAWRARLSTDLLRLTALIDMGPLDAEMGRAGGPTGGWSVYGARLRTTWGATLPDRYRAAANESQAIAGPVLHPFDFGALPIQGDTFPREPAAVLSATRTTAFYRWLGENHYRGDGKALLAVPDCPAASQKGKTLDAVGRDLLTRGS